MRSPRTTAGEELLLSATRERSTQQRRPSTGPSTQIFMYFKTHKEFLKSDSQGQGMGKVEEGQITLQWTQFQFREMKSSGAK